MKRRDFLQSAAWAALLPLGIGENSGPRYHRLVVTEVDLEAKSIIVTPIGEIPRDFISEYMNDPLVPDMEYLFRKHYLDHAKMSRERNKQSN